MSAHSLQATDLLRSENFAQFRPCYERYLDLAASHLAAGWRYANTLPFAQVRLRLACAWPLLIGAATLKKLRSGNVLDERVRLKISRRDVRGLMLQSILYYPWPSRWRQLFARAGE